MNDLITAATSGLFVEIGKIIEHMKAQQARIADLERQLAEASAPAVEQQPVARLTFRDLPDDPFDIVIFDKSRCIDGMKLYTAPQAADTDKVREAILALPYNGTMSQFATKDDMMLHMQGHEDALHEAAALIASTALRAPMREIPGYKLVPVEATEDMQVAFLECWFSKRRGIDDDIGDAYAELIAAAPLPAAPVQQEGGHA